MSSKEFKLPDDFIRFHGRRKGKAIAPLKLALYEKFFPALQYAPSRLDKTKTNVLDIGFGGGENLAEKVIANPEMNYLGAEPFLNGVASLIYHLTYKKEAPPTNIMIFPDDIRQLFREFEDNIFNEVYLLFPDPWRKKRHVERRFIHPDNLTQIHRILKPCGLFIVASDDATYKDHIKEVLSAHTNILTPVYHSDVQPENWTTTRYEAKALKEGRVPEYFIYKAVK